MVQRTFTIVPPAGPAERTPVNNRPMTSKQVRKAYKEANRVPRVSRAEQLRQERAEQERIRKEFEKDKAALKARTLREKKRAKEQAEREEKRKKGLPLVNVRPSQDTIAWFVRGKGSGTKRDCRGQNAAITPVLPIVEEPEEDEGDLPSPKRLCSQEQPKDAGDEEKDYFEEEFEEEQFAAEDVEKPVEKSEEIPPAPEGPVTKVDTAPEKNERTAEEDFLEDFEIMSDDEMSKLSFNQVATKSGVVSAENRLPTCPEATPEERGKGPSHHETTLHKPESPITIKNPKPLALPEFYLISDDEDDLEQEMLALDVALISQNQLSKQPALVLVSQGSQKPARSATGYEMDLGLATGPLNNISQENRSKRDEQASLMPPPPIPAAPQRSRSPISPVAMKPQAPPLSTQQILFNMDDFFPTSSQQAAELEEEETTFISQSLKSCSIPRAKAPSPIAEKDLPPPDTASSSPEPPKPFFTASGSNERLAVALLRSRRTAEQEEEQRRRALQLEALELEEAKKRDSERRAREKRLADSKPKTNTANHTPSKTEPRDKGQPPRQTRPASATTPQFSIRKGFTTNPNRTPANTSVQRTPLVATRANATLPTTKLLPTAEMKRPSPIGNIPRKQSSPTTAKVAIEPQPPEAQNTRHETLKAMSKENTTSPGISEAKHLIASQESEFGGSWMDELATEISL
ncbi:hypothetical protein CI102_13757 [Trichoderma harzianum]|uniref:Uncharacterized protein n=1 Tax=Trichoderma harzianum CBS 226.95 TaxID=983964 RepID=A0A2T3ZS62_TRIHA|nr:hypothetical protein M431DRAFT_21906 [Trichoderma harzianum CBS 226.95]PKK43482.1 hypothetical protein CI102_13757 [Trichoderma harzianum]PTB47640.1 hypothetical protein M431DRAFT_21906 [Trichoderma harzianum CBS 226.95]